MATKSDAQKIQDARIKLVTLLVEAGIHRSMASTMIENLTDDAIVRLGTLGSSLGYLTQAVKRNQLTDSIMPPILAQFPQTITAGERQLLHINPTYALRQGDIVYAHPDRYSNRFYLEWNVHEGISVPVHYEADFLEPQVHTMTLSVKRDGTSTHERTVEFTVEPPAELAVLSSAIDELEHADAYEDDLVFAAKHTVEHPEHGQLWIKTAFLKQLYQGNLCFVSQSNDPDLWVGNYIGSRRYWDDIPNQKNLFQIDYLSKISTSGRFSYIARGYLYHDIVIELGLIFETSDKQHFSFSLSDEVSSS